MVLYAGTRGYLDSVDVTSMPSASRASCSVHAGQRHSDLLNGSARAGAIEDEDKLKDDQGCRPSPRRLGPAPPGVDRRRGSPEG